MDALYVFSAVQRILVGRVWGSILWALVVKTWCVLYAHSFAPKKNNIKFKDIQYNKLFMFTVGWQGSKRVTVCTVSSCYSGFNQNHVSVKCEEQSLVSKPTKRNNLATGLQKWFNDCLLFTFLCCLLYPPPFSCFHLVLLVSPIFPIITLLSCLWARFLFFFTCITIYVRSLDFIWVDVIKPFTFNSTLPPVFISAHHSNDH